MAAPPPRLATLGLAIVGLAIVWGVWSLTYVLLGGVPRGDRFGPDDREWWSLPLALLGVALVAYDAWRHRA